MLIDCARCVARGPACSDCVVTVFLRVAPHRPAEPVADWEPQSGHATVELDESERAAVQALAAAGLVPPLRLVSGIGSNYSESA
jgi:hypothetical protein